MNTEIAGVRLHPLRQIQVPKGDLWHAVKATDPGYEGFGEVYFTQIAPHEAKGWKRHNRYALNLVVVAGAVKFVVYDDRPTSPTCGCFQEITLSPRDNYQRLTVAPGLWMAFAGAAPEGTSLLMDLIPGVHDPAECDRKDLDEIPYSFGV